MKAFTISIMLFCMVTLSNAQEPPPDFSIDPLISCIDGIITITPLIDSTYYDSWYWNFCAANPADMPEADILDIPPDSLNIPVFIALAKDGDEYYAYATNHGYESISNSISRISFGSSMLNPAPEIEALGTAIPGHPEGIKIIKDGDNWYGFVIGGKIDNNQVNRSFFRRLNFGLSLNNISPSVTTLDIAGAHLNFPHDLYMFQDDGVWYGLTVNMGNQDEVAGPDGTISRFKFAQGLNNPPEAVNLGNPDDIFYDPVSLFPIYHLGNWYVFVVDRITGLIRVNFPNGLAGDQIEVHPLGNLDGVLGKPRAISLLSYCDDYYGYVVNENTQSGASHFVRLHFGGNLENTPTAYPISELNSFFVFPHSISDVIIEDDAIFTLVTNAEMNAITRVFFPTCEDDLPPFAGYTPPTISYSIPGIYTIELIVNSGASNPISVCKDVIVKLPTAQFVNSFDTICDGIQLVIPILFTGDQPWDFRYTDGNDTIPHDNITTNPFPLILNPGTTTVYEIVSIADKDCDGVPIGNPLEIYVIPKDDAGFSYPSGTFCQNSSPVEPTVNLAGGEFSSTPIGLVINNLTGIITPEESELGTYSVTYSVYEVCPDSLTLQIRIDSLALADFSYALEGYCPNGVNPTPEHPANSGPGVFSTSSEGLILDQVSGEIILNGSLPGVYMVYNEILPGSGCPYEIDSTQVEIYHLPVPEFTSDTVCLGELTTLTDNSTIAEGSIENWVWYFGDELIGSGNQIQYIFPDDGNHSVRLEAVSDNLCAKDTMIDIFVKALPEIDLLRKVPTDWSISEDRDTIYACVYNSVTLDAGDPNNPHRIFEWSVGAESDTISIGALGIGYELHHYEVTITDTLTGCSYTAAIVVEFSMAACEIGVDDLAKHNGISIYPNPASDKLFIEVRKIIGDFSIEIFNIQGSMIGSEHFLSPTNNELYEMDVSGYKSGVYFVRLKSHKVIHTVKLIVANP